MLSKTTSSGETAFPWKLHILLDESERQGFDSIISWQGSRAFKVHDPIQFENIVMKRFFNQTQYKSFQRQLNIYGFTRVKAGKTKIPGSYTHKLLIRGNPDVCRFMIRTKVKKIGIKSDWKKKKAEEVKSSASVVTPLRRTVTLENVAISRNKSGRPDLPRRISKSPHNVPMMCSSSCDIMEPTPIKVGSLGPSKSTIATMNAVRFLFQSIANKGTNCENGCVADKTLSCSSNTIQGRGVQHMEQRDPVRINANRFLLQDQQRFSGRNVFSQCNENDVELDLDTIFEDDNRGNTNTNNTRNTYIDNYIDIDSCCMTPAPVDTVFDRNFALVEDF